jgi:hypothetical protein
MGMKGSHRMSRLNKIFLAVLATAVLAVGVAAPASAQSSLQGYSDEGPAIQDQVSGVSGVAPAETTQASTDGGSGSLPFTGLDLALLIGAGAVLAGAGVGMRLMARPREVA